MPGGVLSLHHGGPFIGTYGRRQYLAEKLADMAGRYARKKVNEYIKSAGKRRPGRPAGSKNKPKAPPGSTKFTNRFNAARTAGRTRYSGAANTPAVQKLQWSVGQSLNRVKRPLKGNFGPKGVIVVNKKKGKQLRLQKRKFDQVTYTTAFIGSNPNLDDAGNMGKLDERYTFPSVDSSHCQGIIYNVGGVPQYWNPMAKGKIGNQTIDNSDDECNLYRINSANSDIEKLEYMIKQQKLPETSTPFNTGELPVNHIYRTPNTILASVDINMKFTAASVQDNLITIQVVRATAPIPIIPGDLGHEETESPFSKDKAKFMLTNSPVNCNGHFLQILYTKTFLLKGINLNAKHPATKYVRKKVAMNFLRSTCRRESSAAVDDLDYKLGGEWKASFSTDETGAMFNNVYVKILSKVVTKTAKANMQVGQLNGALGTVSKAYTVPTYHNMDSSTGPFEYTDLKNARFRFGGTIGVKHYCQEISRGFGNSEMTTLTNLQNQINQLQDVVAQAQIDDCTSCDEESVHTDSETDHSDSDHEDLGGPGDHHPDAPLATDHTHPFDGTATDHEATANGQVHSH